MSKINIKNLNGENIVVGDNNTINNNFTSDQGLAKVLTRDDYYQMMLEIRELERISVGDYLEDKFEKYSKRNPDFVKILYKDISKVLDGVDHDGDNDLVIENGDFVIEYGDLKLSGHPTNLHFAVIWLNIKLIELFATNGIRTYDQNMENFENDFLKHNYDTHAYSKKLKALTFELKKERNSKDNKGWVWNDLIDYVELKPNIAGIGINFNAILKRISNKK